jgi:hypothetical protein
MSNSPLVSAVLAFLLAVSGFAGLSLQSPSAYPVALLWEGPLVADVVFDDYGYDYLDVMHVKLVYRNLSDRAQSFNLTYPIVYHDYWNGERGDRGIGGEHSWELITLPAHSEYIVREYWVLADDVGYYQVEWDGVERGVEIRYGGVVPRIVSEKQFYRLDDRVGHAVFELYNPTGHNVTVRYLPSDLFFSLVYPDGISDPVYGVHADWALANVTISPGGSFRVFSTYFFIRRTGRASIEGVGAKTTIDVLPAR